MSTTREYDTFAQGVQRVTDVFDPKTFKFIDEESCQKLDDQSTMWHVNKTNWTAVQPYISNYGQAGTILQTKVSDKVRDLMMAAMDKHLNFDFNRDDVNFQHQYMFRGAFIPWHTDNHCDVACSFYLQNFDPNNGGIYLYSDNEETGQKLDRADLPYGQSADIDMSADPYIKGVIACKNSMLLQHRVSHSVTALHPMTPVRRSIQAFLTYA